MLKTDLRSVSLIYMTFWRQLAPEQHRFELGRSTDTQIFYSVVNTSVLHNPRFAEPQDVEEGTTGTEQPHTQRADSKCRFSTVQGVSAPHLVVQGSVVLCFFFLAVPCGLRGLSSLTKDWTRAQGSESRVLTTGLPRNSPNRNFKWEVKYRCSFYNSTF